ncbi:MAG: hypothetical protein ACOX6T_26730 [Myxococcales bacterium]|jgi:hypothetical protein
MNEAERARKPPTRRRGVYMSQIVRDGRLSAADRLRALRRGVCPDCGRPLKVLERPDPKLLIAGCRHCDIKREAKRGGTLFRMLTAN